MIEYGGLFWRASQLETAARTGARTGALSGGTSGTVNAAITALLAADGLGATGYTVTLAPADPSALAAGSTFTVSVSVPYSAITLTNCPLVPVPTTISRSCTMVRESG
jgi:Flp pilus assembly protein TadG